MYYNDKDKSYLNHWYNWAAEGREKEQLFYEIELLVRDMIKSIFPDLITEFKEKIRIEISAAIDSGKIDLSGLKQSIIDYINKNIS